ncbi:PLD-like domain protein [Leptospira semungkisensis]|uniref:phospholipase D n=1 Tax=Leptospira semungkisensis TaxID=2484985 RepID=A0A4R9FLK8_9LEPT|nr:phospholipase D-like domain-containing protein [Leptospira semungkisensis]TGJ99222.1 PLD-like domain protein [Leptospira semungkisensis]
MKKILYLIFLLPFCSINEEGSGLTWEEDHSPKAFFSYPGRFVPEAKKRNVREEILRLIRETKHSIYMHVYSLDDPEIEDELLLAHSRGVDLQIMGEWGKKYPNAILPFLRYWDGSGLQHSKVLVSDHKTVFLGTGNFTFYGLERDHNGYIEFSLLSKDWEKFHSFLREEYPFVTLKIGDLEFKNSPNDGFRIQDRLFTSAASARESIRYLIFDHYDPILSLGMALSKADFIAGVYDRPVDPEGKLLSSNSRFVIQEDGNEDILDDESLGKGGLLHHKTLIIDDLELLTGSYNYSLSARDSNREILVRTKNENLVSQFKDEWQRVEEKASQISSYEMAPSSNTYQFDPVHSTVCKQGTNSEDIFLDIGFSWFRWIQLYRFLETDVCKSLQNYESISSRNFGGRSEFPSVGTLDLGARLLDRSANTLATSSQTSLMAELEEATKKPVLFLRPEILIFSEPAWTFENSKMISIWINSQIPIQAWIFHRGKLPKKSEVNVQNEVYFLKEALETSTGMILLEYQDFSLYFCYKSANDSLRWTQDLLLSIADGHIRQWKKEEFPNSWTEFFSETGLPNQRRENLCTVGF